MFRKFSSKTFRDGKNISKVFVKNISKCFRQNKNIKGEKKIDNNLIIKLAPKIVEGINKLKKWSESI